MTDLLQRRLAHLSQEENRALLSQGLRGIERETLRIDASGKLAATSHPHNLGSALTHSQITTDYAEALLEFITPAEQDIATALRKLDAIHRYAYSQLGGELLWSESMPCQLPDEENIEIGWYGHSHIGMLKHVYRRGLALRYGKTMQCIAGIHYNYSLSEKLWRSLQVQEDFAGTPMDFQSESYIALIRNFRRYSWLLMYLFGASPALSSNFLRGRSHRLERLSDDTMYLPYATSLRMSDLGYQNDAQAGLTPQENSLDSYVNTLSRAVNQAYPPYAEWGTKRDGEWIQISTNVLQIENEYYSTIRPKRVIHMGERPIQALCSRGVQYIEVRCLDVDPFEPVGISVETSRFIDAFLLFCALDDSPSINEEQSCQHTDNFARVVKEGRRPGLMLQRESQPIGMQTWGLALLEKIGPVAALLDAHRDDTAHATAIAAQQTKLMDPELTPSARVLAALQTEGNSFSRFGLRQSQTHAAHFLANPLSAEEMRHFTALAEKSHQDQQEIERAQTGNFDEFVAAYRASTLCQVCN